MGLIDASVTRDMKNHKITYSFEFDNKHFTVHFYSGKNPKAELYNDKYKIGFIDQSNNCKRFLIYSDLSQINISIWMEFTDISYGFSVSKLVNEVGIDVNGNPVKNTLADREIKVKEGIIGLILLFIYFIY